MLRYVALCRAMLRGSLYSTWSEQKYQQLRMVIPTTFPGHGMEPVTASRRRWKASEGGSPQSEPFSSWEGTDLGYSVYTFSIPPILLKPGNGENTLSIGSKFFTEYIIKRICEIANSCLVLHFQFLDSALSINTSLKLILIILQEEPGWKSLGIRD